MKSSDQFINEREREYEDQRRMIRSLQIPILEYVNGTLINKTKNKEKNDGMAEMVKRLGNEITV